MKLDVVIDACNCRMVPYHCVPLAVVALVFGPTQVTAGETWKAGTARNEKITPSEPMWMAGYGTAQSFPPLACSTTCGTRPWCSRTRPGRGWRSSRSTWSASDAIWRSRFCANLDERYHLTRSQVAIFCSHTHSGPVIGHNLHAMHYDLVDEIQQQRIDRYADTLRATIVGLRRRQGPSTTCARGPALVRPRQGHVRRQSSQQQGGQRAVAAHRRPAARPVGHDVPVLKIASANDKEKLSAVCFGYACHATVLDGYHWSSDYPGFAQPPNWSRSFPAQPPCFVAGCGADQNPLPRRQVALANNTATTWPPAVDAALRGYDPISGKLSTRRRRSSLAAGAHVPDPTNSTRRPIVQDRFVASRPRPISTTLARASRSPASYPYPIQLWRIGDD